MSFADAGGADYGSTIYKFFVGLNKVSGVKAKQKSLADIAENFDPELVDLIQQCLKFAYDDEIRFGITLSQLETSATISRSPRPFDRSVFTMLNEVIDTRGHQAKAGLIERYMTELSEDSRALLQNIIGKDLRCGISNSTINKVFPGLLSRFEVMLAKPFAARHVKAWPVAIEPKLDGLRVVALVDPSGDGSVTFYTRSGKEITSLDNFKPEVLLLASAMCVVEGESYSFAFDGEVTSGTFLESMSSVRKGDTQVEEGTFHVFDVLTRTPGRSPIALEDDELAKQGSYKVRRARLQAGMKRLKSDLEGSKIHFIQVVDSYLAKSEAEVMTYYARSRENGLEGIIIKDVEAPYVKKRNAAWMKIKGQETLDLPVIGAFEGEGKYVGMLGGLVVNNNGVEVRVGGGFSDFQRQEFWDAFQADLQRIDRGDRDACVLIDTPAEVEFQEQLPSGSLRHPVFKRLRNDKKMGAVGAF